MNRMLFFALTVLATFSLTVSLFSAENTPKKSESLERSDPLPDGVLGVMDIKDSYFQLWQYSTGKPLILLYGGLKDTAGRDLLGQQIGGLTEVRTDELSEFSPPDESPTDALEAVEEIEQYRRLLPQYKMLVLDWEAGPTTGKAYTEAYPEYVIGVVVPMFPDPPPEELKNRHIPGSIPPVTFEAYQAMVREFENQFQGVIHDRQPVIPEDPDEDREKKGNSFMQVVGKTMSAVAVILGF